MAKSKTTFEKMMRERAKQQKKKEKLERKEIKKSQKEDDEILLEEGEDPDLAGIVAGPQPVEDIW